MAIGLIAAPTRIYSPKPEAGVCSRQGTYKPPGGGNRVVRMETPRRRRQAWPEGAEQCLREVRPERLRVLIVFRALLRLKSTAILRPGSSPRCLCIVALISIPSYVNRAMGKFSETSCF